MVKHDTSHDGVISSDRRCSNGCQVRGDRGPCQIRAIVGNVCSECQRSSVVLKSPDRIDLSSADELHIARFVDVGGRISIGRPCQVISICIVDRPIIYKFIVSGIDAVRGVVGEQYRISG